MLNRLVARSGTCGINLLFLSDLEGVELLCVHLVNLQSSVESVPSVCHNTIHNIINLLQTTANCPYNQLQRLHLQ